MPSCREFHGGGCFCLFRSYSSFRSPNNVGQKSQYTSTDPSLNVSNNCRYFILLRIILTSWFSVLVDLIFLTRSNRHHSNKNTPAQVIATTLQFYWITPQWIHVGFFHWLSNCGCSIRKREASEARRKKETKLVQSGV